MNTILRGALSLLILATLTASAEVPAHADGNRLFEDLDQLASWLEGRFDNDLQVRQEQGSDDTVRLHSLFVPQDFPELGKQVFYVQQSLDDNPRKVHRQRFYLFEADREADAIRLKVYVPSDPSALFDLHKEPQKRTGLKVSDLDHEASCDVLLTRKRRGKKGDHFEGATTEGLCREESSKYSKTLVITKEIRLDENTFWILEQAHDQDGTLVYGPASGEAQKLRKANTYLCLSFDRDDDGAWKEARSFEIHDQGNLLRMDPNQSGQRTAHLYHLGAESKKGGEETLQLVIQERGQEAPLGTSIAKAGGESLGIETPSLKITCQRQDDWIRQGVRDP